MILGRSTAQWSGLLTALTGFLTIVIPVLFPNIDNSQLNYLLGATVIFLGVFIAFLANTSLTPVGDPRLAIGQVVNAGLPNQGVVRSSDAEVKEVVQVPALVEAKQ